MDNKEKKEFLEFQIFKLKKQKLKMEEKIKMIENEIKDKTSEMKTIKIYKTKK